MENLCWTGQRSGRRACCLKPLLVASPKWNFSKACKMHLSVPPLDLPVAFGATAPQALKTLGSILGEKSNALQGGGVNWIFFRPSCAHKSSPVRCLPLSKTAATGTFSSRLNLELRYFPFRETGTPGSSFSADCAFGHAAFCVHFPGLQMSRHYQVFSTWSLSHPPCHVLDTTKLPATVKLPGSPPTKYIGQHQQRIGFQVSNLHQWRPRLTRIIM